MCNPADGGWKKKIHRGFRLPESSNSQKHLKSDSIHPRVVYWRIVLLRLDFCLLLDGTKIFLYSNKFSKKSTWSENKLNKVKFYEELSVLWKWNFKIQLQSKVTGIISIFCKWKISDTSLQNFFFQYGWILKSWVTFLKFFSVKYYFCAKSNSTPFHLINLHQRHLNNAWKKKSHTAI